MMGACGGGGTDWDCAGAACWAPPFTNKGVGGGGAPVLWLLLLLLVGGEVVLVGVGRNRPPAW